MKTWDVITTGKEWIIASSESMEDGITLTKAVGNDEQIIQYLCERVAQARSEWPQLWEFGTEKPEDITREANGAYKALACFCDGDIRYTAIPADNLDCIRLEVCK